MPAHILELVSVSIQNRYAALLAIDMKHIVRLDDLRDIGAFKTIDHGQFREGRALCQDRVD